MLFRGGQGRRAHLIRDLKEPKEQAIPMFMERETGTSRRAHEPSEEVQAAGAELRGERGGARGRVGPGQVPPDKLC